jgi:tyrosinase
MTFSRRNVLLEGCMIGAGVIATNVPGVVALAQAQQPPQRRSLGVMALNDPILEAWRDGVRQLKSRPASNRISWASFAGIHGNNTGFKLCPHGNWYFLPWHRAYLLMYERTVRQLTGHNDFALPYWDWTTNRQLPTAFVQPTWNGQTNPLFEPTRTMSPTDSLPDGVVGPNVITQILGETDFESFGTTRPNQPGNIQNSLDQSWIVCEFCGIQGTLESNPHNTVHNRVGGLMRSAQSSLDPIFMMHHCNIDRIWAVWNAPPLNNQNTNDPLWTGMTFQNNFYNPDGSFYSPKVSELVTPETLGYTYGLPSAPVAAGASPVLVALSDKLKTLYATPNVTDVPGIRVYVKEGAQPIPAANAAVEIVVDNIDRSLLSAVARRGTASAGTDLLDFPASRAQAALGTRALAFLRDLSASQFQNTLYRVFINCDYLSLATPISDPHYVGAFGIFGDHGEHASPVGGPAAKPSIAVDLTRTIQRVYGSSIEAPEKIRIQILPTPNDPNGGPTGAAVPSRVELAFVSN